jgi:hypothetical protein
MNLGAFPSVPGLSSWSLSIRLSYQNFLSMAFMYATCPASLILFALIIISGKVSVCYHGVMQRPAQVFHSSKQSEIGSHDKLKKEWYIICI